MSNVEVLTWAPSADTMRIMSLAESEKDVISEEVFQELDAIVKMNSDFIVPEMVVLDGPGAGGPGAATGLEDTLDTIKDVLKVTAEAAKAGKLIFKKLGPYLGPIGACASVIIKLIEIGQPKKEDPVMKELKEVEYQLSKMSEKMTAQFEDLKAFMVESDFYSRYAVATRTLFKYMADTMTDPSNATRDEFARVYKESNPKKLVYDLVSMLELEKTNPLKLAMAADPLKKTATFEKWAEILDSVLTQALFIEKFASGFLYNNDNSEVDRIVKEIGKFMELTKTWDQYYKTNSLWWKDGLKQLVERVQDDGSLNHHEKKAEAIWREMMEIHTDDQFFLVVYGDHISRWDVTDHSKVFWSFRGGYHVVIYCTKPNNWNSADWYHGLPKLNIKHKFSQAYMFDHWQMVRNWMTNDRMKSLSNHYKPSAMFLGVAQHSGCIALKHTTRGNCGRLGPGGFTFEPKLKVSDGFTSTKQPLFFLVGGW